VIQVDKEGLDKQVKEEIEHRLAQERALAEYGAMHDLTHLKIRLRMQIMLIYITI
jgi:hypothetical protein